MTELVLIRAYPNRFEAELAQQHLADLGIDAMVQADDAGGMYAGLSLGRKGVRLLVRAADARCAVEVLQEMSDVERGDGTCDDDTADPDDVPGA